MKRIILVCLCSISILSASAQVWVGGTLGASNRKTRYEEEGKSTQLGFSLGPTVGYDLNQHLTLALGLYYFQSNDKSSVPRGTSRSRQQQLSISPYLRYYFAECGDVRFFCKGGISVSRSWFNNKTRLDGETTWDNTTCSNLLGVEFCPGISYMLNDRVNLLGTLGDIGWVQEWYGGESVHHTQFYANIYNSFSIGFQIYL